MNHSLLPGFNRLRGLTLCALLCLALQAGWAHAEESDVDSTRVARISYLLGNIQVQTTADDGDGTWSTAGINQPLSRGDALRTEARARAELQLGNANLQLDENTQIQLTELSDHRLRFELLQGRLNLQVRSRDTHDQMEINTPHGVMAVTEPGTYGVQVAERNVTLIQVQAGTADVSADRQRFSVHANQQLRLSGDINLAAQFDSIGGRDEFDRWAAERNQRAERGVANRYVSTEVIGYEDLDDYGDWQYSADYGYVWLPTRVSYGWAPYRYGRWRWVNPWGWTWIDDAPWGFAPFHYGRWTTIRNRWCWVPGPRGVRPVYAPALVGWLGTPGASVSVNVGWVPLGPREIYRPLYRSSPDYVVNVNLSNTRLTRREFDRDFQRRQEPAYRNHAALSVVAREALHESRPVQDQLRTERRTLRPIDALPVPENRGRVIETETSSFETNRARVNEPRVWRREPLQPGGLQRSTEPRSMAVTPEPGATREPREIGERNRGIWRAAPEMRQPEPSAPPMRNEARRSIHEAAGGWRNQGQADPQPSSGARDNSAPAQMQAPNRDRGRRDGDRR